MLLSHIQGWISWPSSLPSGRQLFGQALVAYPFMFLKAEQRNVERSSQRLCMFLKAEQFNVDRAMAALDKCGLASEYSEIKRMGGVAVHLAR